MKKIKLSPSDRRTQSAHLRSGVTLVENAIVLSMLAMTIFCMLDLGLAVLRYNTLSEAARRLAREASLHGELAAPERPIWGTETHEGNAADDSEFAEVIATKLVTIDPADVAMQIDWIDGGNAVGDRVRVRLIYLHNTMIPLFLGGGIWELSATSIMRIVH